MVIEYEKDFLKELYEEGKCKSKKYRLEFKIRIEDVEPIMTIRIITDVAHHYR